MFNKAKGGKIQTDKMFYKQGSWVKDYGEI
jgi:hypothetical protein